MAATRIHEVDFCARVAVWADTYFANSDSPFSSSGIEGFGTGELKNKRRDLRFNDRATGRIAITGEVKLPRARDGDSPYNEAVIQDAAQKADNAGVQYFFTWNVNAFALWDRKKWNVPLLERRVREWQLGRHLRNSEELARSENLEFIRLKFLPDLLRDLGRIYRGQQPDWAMAPDDIFIRSLETHLAWPIDATEHYDFSEISSDIVGRVFQRLVSPEERHRGASTSPATTLSI